MASQEQENDRYEAIREYIKENEGCTKAQVIDYMKGRSAVVTTHKIIMKLIEKGTVLVEPDKKNRQTHHLHINDKIEIIEQQLNKIKELMDLMDDPIRRMLKHQLPLAANYEELSRQLEDTKQTNSDDIYGHFILPYEDAVSMMLNVLFAEIRSSVLSENDKQSLRTRIVILMNRLSRQIYYVTNVKGYFYYTIYQLKTVELSTTKTFAKKNKIDLGLRQNIIETIQNFESNFLPTN